MTECHPVLTGSATVMPAELAPMPELCRRAQAGDDPADALRALRDRIADLEGAHVRAMLRDGASWTDVAEALGTSRQAAHRRFRDLRVARPAPAATRTDVHRVLVTSDARGIVRAARREAERQRAAAIGTEHLLLALLCADVPGAAAALRRAGVTEEAVRAALQPTVVEGELRAADGGFTPLARQVLEGSLREAVERGEGFIGADHLLLALLRHDDGGAARTLEALGVAREAVRAQLATA